MTVSVVLLHALGLDARMWAAQEAALRAAGHEVWAPNQCGSLDAAADDIAQGLDERGVDRAVLVGSSMGGYVAMAFLRRHPGRTAALALLGTRAGADDTATAAGRRAFAGAYVDPARRPGMIAAVLPGLVGATTRARRPAVLDRVTALVEAADPVAVASSQRAIADRQDSLDVLRATDVPAVVIAGAEDALVSVEDARQMADALPQAELVVVPEAGHLAPMEAPAEVTAALAGLLRRAMVVR